MKAVAFKEHGDANVLKVCDYPDPKPEAGEVLIDLKASGINHLDIWVRQGMPGVKLPLPRIPGSDGAGLVGAVGDGVKEIKVGDRVIVSPGMGCGRCLKCTGGWDSLCPKYHLLGLQIDGTYCQKVVVPERRVIKVSDRYSYEEWASTPLVFLTAWHMLVTHGDLKAGESVLIHAAGSGIGSAAIQIAKYLGAKVFTTVGSDAKVDKAKKLGADEVILYKEKDFSEEIKRLTDSVGVAMVFEHIGPETWKKNLVCLSKGGRLVTCGATSGPSVDIDLRFLFMNQHTIKGSYMGSREELIRVTELLEKGTLKPVLDRTFKLEEADKAHTYMDSRQNFGKIVLTN